MNEIEENYTYWKNYPKCSECNHSMVIIFSRSYEGALPGEPTQYGYEIKYRCLHCFHIEWERDGT